MENEIPCKGCLIYPRCSCEYNEFIPKELGLVILYNKCSILKEYLWTNRINKDIAEKRYDGVMLLLCGRDYD